MLTITRRVMAPVHGPGYRPVMATETLNLTADAGAGDDVDSLAPDEN